MTARSRSREVNAAPNEWSESSDHCDRQDRADPVESAEPTDRTDPAEPMLPIEATEPTLPMDSTEPREPIDSRESVDHSDRREEPVEVMSGLCGTPVVLATNWIRRRPGVPPRQQIFDQTFGRLRYGELQVAVRLPPNPVRSQQAKGDEWHAAVVDELDPQVRPVHPEHDLGARP